MTTTDHTTPTGQDFLAMSLIDLATQDSRERFEELAAKTWNPEFVTAARDSLFEKAPEIPATLPVSEVRDLEFVRISDNISHKWAIWEVRFTYDGKPCAGFLGGCPTYPDLMHEEKIEECETDF